jgi:hypothetical protein
MKLVFMPNTPFVSEKANTGCKCTGPVFEKKKHFRLGLWPRIRHHPTSEENRLGSFRDQIAMLLKMSECLSKEPIIDQIDVRTGFRSPPSLGRG